MIGLAHRRAVDVSTRSFSRDNLARAIAPTMLLPALQDAWHRLADEGTQIAACAVERVYDRADGSFVLSLDAAFRAGQNIHRQPLIAEIPSGDAKPQFNDLLRRFRKSKRRHHLKDAANPREFCLVPELNLIVRHAGLDEKIDGIDLLHAPDRLYAILVDAPEQTRLLAHRLHRRCVIEVSRSDAPPLFLKFYKRGSGRFAHNAGLVRFLERTAFRETGAIRVPRVVQVLPELAGFAMASAPGHSLNGLQGTARIAGMALAGEALGRLHRLPLRLAAKFAADDEVRMLSRLVELTGDTLPGLRKALNAGLDRVASRLAAGQAFELCTVHRDFHERQIIVDGETCHLIDFDTACNGDPHLDIGNFLAHLDFAALQGVGGNSEAAIAFLEAYASAHREPSRDHVAAYRKSTLLRLACIYAFTTRWSHLSSPLIELVHGSPA